MDMDTYITLILSTIGYGLVIVAMLAGLFWAAVQDGRPDRDAT